jgi:hypothetical protein
MLGRARRWKFSRTDYNSGFYPISPPRKRWRVVPEAPAANMDHPRAEIEAIYAKRREAFAAAENLCAARDRWLTHLRLIAFLASVALCGLGWISGHASGWYWAGGLAFVGFIALAAYHEEIERRQKRNRILRQINEQALARLRRDWAALPEIPVAIPAEHRAVAGDLDLFGHASIFQFLCSAHTPTGIRILRDWLLNPAPPQEIHLRQQAVTELAPQLELRETLTVESRLLEDRSSATDRFIDWAEGGVWLRSRPVLQWACRIVPACGVLALLAIACGLLSPEVGTATVLVVWAINFLLTVLFVGNVHDVFEKVSSRSGEVRRYLQIFHLMYSMPDSTSKLDAIKQDATEHGGGVMLRMKTLNLITRLAGIRHSALFFIFVYLPLQLCLLFDFHVLDLMEGWQQRHGGFVRRWFQALGEFEALASLAVVAHDYPDWVLPSVDNSADRFDAGGLGHPLLPDDVRVANDVQVGPKHSFLLVTGSNMSGKSTLLRAIGANAVLAQAGAPVCAKNLSMPPLVLATSMRIHDSLEYGVSFYMAELMRLKQIVDTAGTFQQSGNRQLLYLLDEILQGTNSKERHIAVVRVLHYLLDHGAIGAVSTHDLELATSQPLIDACTSVHFRETLHDQDADQPMTFDYRLRPGVATTTNALKLLEIVGLGDK